MLISIHCGNNKLQTDSTTHIAQSYFCVCLIFDIPIGIYWGYFKIWPRWVFTSWSNIFW